MANLMITDIGTPDGLTTVNVADIADKIADFGNSLGTNGYQKLPNGLIIQWFDFTAVADLYQDIVFPIAFPNICLQAVGSMGTTGAESVSTTVLTTISVTNTAVRYGWSGGIYTWTSRWIAIGY